MSKVEVTLYGKKHEFVNSDKAKLFLLECIMASEGSERDRYVTAYTQLMEGKTEVSDIE